MNWLFRNFHKNFSGEYKCNVQTFESNDEKSAFIQVVVPENQFLLEQISDKRTLLIRCSAMSIFPEPKLVIK